MNAFGLITGHLVGDIFLQTDWMAANKGKDSVACLIHCVFYTLGVALFTWAWMPWWCLLLVFATHYPIDRWGLARKAMRFHHEAFATGKLSPWSVVLFDLIMHFVTLFLIGTAAAYDPPTLTSFVIFLAVVLVLVLAANGLLYYVYMRRLDRLEDLRVGHVEAGNRIVFKGDGVPLKAGHAFSCVVLGDEVFRLMPNPMPGTPEHEGLCAAEKEKVYQGTLARAELAEARVRELEAAATKTQA